MQDILIIGGGPAGSTAGTLLAREGHQVTLLEKARFPREHVGESLLPFCFELFQSLGVLDQFKSMFVRKPSVRFLSCDGTSATNWCFNEVIKDDSFLSFHVDRKIFDERLLNNARTHGVDVQEETKVTNVRFDEAADCVEVTSRQGNGGSQKQRARFLIDASGRSSFLASSNGWRVPNQGFERTAIWTHWSDVRKMTHGLEQGSALIIYLGGEKRGWIWVFPLSDGHVTAGVVMETAYLQSQKQELLNQGVQNWQRELYRQELMESAVSRKILADAKEVRPVMVEGDYSYNSTQNYGRRFALVGDANRFVDPIFSSGVYLSMKSAQLTASALDTMLQKGNLDNNAGLQAAYRKINGAYGFVHDLISLFYNPHATSFADAGAAFTDHEDHRNAMAAGHYILAGDFFENHEKYRLFLKTLSNSRKFEMYRNLVIDPRSSKKEGCKLSPAQKDSIFPGATH